MTLTQAMLDLNLSTRKPCSEGENIPTATCRMKEDLKKCVWSFCRLKSHSWGFSHKKRRRNGTSQIIRERKVIVIFFSFIIALSTEHFSKYFIFSWNLIVRKESTTTFIEIHHSSLQPAQLLRLISLRQRNN